MFKQKNQHWRRELRRWQIQQLKRTQRERVMLINDLNEHLAIFPQCSLFNGGEQQMQHYCFLDCQTFAVSFNRTLFELVKAVGTENCKEVLLECNLAGVLYSLTDAIQNKTVPNDNEEHVRQFYSRSSVLDSITNLLCLLTEDEELVAGFGQYAVSVLAGALRTKYHFGNATPSEHYPIIALLNLFTYQDFKAAVYRELRGINFEPLIGKEWMKIVDNRQSLGEVEILLMELFRTYLRYQKDSTEDRPHSNTRFSLLQLLHYLFAPQNRKFIEAADEGFLDELMKIIESFDIPSQNASQVLTCSTLTPLLSYIELFSKCTENQCIKLKDFNQRELAELLSMEKVEKNREKYGEYVACILLDLIIDSEDEPRAVETVRLCLSWGGLAEEFSNRPERAFLQLFRLLDTHIPDPL